MVDSVNQRYKFRGGVWIGFEASTWPFGALEVSEDELAIIDENLTLTGNVSSKRERRFTHDEIEKIEVKKYFPIIAYGIQIVPRDKTKGTLLYFWYAGFRFKRLINALKQFGWI